ncbi:MAG: ubiquinone/menaquinone biosynthesis methyltransferase [Candidatus Cloacimonetes bacterium]|nr:ubiquinone/menaquinone biosynthesis methyltransferase [Candidatus Cloacimonadota bacterium]
MALEESKVLENYFDEIAPNYELMNSLLSLNLDKIWRQRLLNEALKDKPETILDVACGTCDILRLFLSKNNSLKVFGLDLSFGMLNEGKQRDKKLNLIRGNGVKTPLPDNSFDVITIAFGFRNMPNYLDFLVEANRLLKPKGKLIILELTQPQNPILRFGNTIYLKSVLPFVSSFFGRNNEAYDYLARSIQAFPSQESVMELFQKANFSSHNYKLNQMGITTQFIGIK